MGCNSMAIHQVILSPRCTLLGYVIPRNLRCWAPPTTCWTHLSWKQQRTIYYHDALRRNFHYSYGYFHCYLNFRWKMRWIVQYPSCQDIRSSISHILRHSCSTRHRCPFDLEWGHCLTILQQHINLTTCHRCQQDSCMVLHSSCPPLLRCWFIQRIRKAKGRCSYSNPHTLPYLLTTWMLVSILTRTQHLRILDRFPRQNCRCCHYLHALRMEMVWLGWNCQRGKRQRKTYQTTTCWCHCCSC